MAALSLHHLTALDTTPVALIAIAGRLGCDHVMLPGEGAFLLADILAALSADGVIAVEVPQKAVMKAGTDPETRCARAVAATRSLLTLSRPLRERAE